MPQGASKSKKYTYIWISAIILVFGTFAISEIARRLKDQQVVQSDRMSVGIENQDLGYLVLDGKKRKVPSFKLINQDSLYITNKDLEGKVYVLDFFFSTCPTICPVMTQNMANLQNTFKDIKNFELVSITINPRYDTPQVLKNYGQRYQANFDNWHFLTGNRDEIFELSDSGFSLLIKEDAAIPGGFEHSGMFALVDKNGFLRSRYDSFGNPIIYYRGAILESQGVNEEGETQQITQLKEDIQQLMAE